jgi:hypothetical protein
VGFFFALIFVSHIFHDSWGDDDAGDDADEAQSTLFQLFRDVPGTGTSKNACNLLFYKGFFNKYILMFRCSTYITYLAVSLFRLTVLTKGFVPSKEGLGKCVFRVEQRNIATTKRLTS